MYKVATYLTEATPLPSIEPIMSSYCDQELLQQGKAVIMKPRYLTGLVLRRWNVCQKLRPLYRNS